LAFERDEASVSARVNAELASSKVADALHQQKLADDAIAERDSKLKLSQECENRLRTALSDAKSQHAAHEAELSERVVSLEREVSDARSSNDKMQAEIHSLRAMVSSLPSADAAEELASASSELEKLRTSLSSTQEQLQELRQENASLHEQLDARSSEIETARSQTQQQKEKAKTLQQSLDAALKWKGTAESLQQELETSRAMCEKMELQYERMKGKASELEASVNGLQQEREHARSAEAAKGSKLQSAEEQMDRLERKRIEEIQRLEEEKKNALQCYEDERTQRQSLEGRVEAQQNIMSQYESKKDRMQSESEDVMTHEMLRKHYVDLRSELESSIASQALERALLEAETDVERELCQEMERERARAENQLAEVYADYGATRLVEAEQNAESKTPHSNSRGFDGEGRQDEIEEASADACFLQEIKELRNERDKVVDERDSLHSDCEELRKELGCRLTIEESKSIMKKLNEESEARKKSLNELHTRLHGRIRVFARIRGGVEESPAAYSESNTTLIVDAEAQQHRYSFDRVFDQSSGTQQVFSELERLCQSVIDGYNALVAAYGQTGSGKTYTMLGDSSSPGVSLLAMETIFGQLESMCIGSKYHVKVAMCEIYGEVSYDLLSSGESTVRVFDCQDRKATHIQGLEWMDINSCSEFMKLYQMGKKGRRTGNTAANADSSRSHAVIFVHVSSWNHRLGRSTSATLHFADLAGNERSRADDAAHHLSVQSKEKDAINKSLTTLKQVLDDLVTGKQHVSFRSSLLTRVLKGALADDSKVALIVNINPSQSSLSETLNALEFAQSISRSARGSIMATSKQTNSKNPKETSLRHVNNEENKENMGYMKACNAQFTRRGISAATGGGSR
jgi:hypothetical protein